MTELHNLAREAGIQVAWRDIHGADRIVADDSLIALLAALGLPAGSPPQIAASLAALHAERHETAPPLVTAEANAPIHLPGAPGQYQINLESGGVLTGTAASSGTGIVLPAIAEPGYHRLEIAGSAITLAVAPPSCFTLADAAGPGRKLWGLAVQLYSLRRAGDGGIGDFAALEDFARRAAHAGAAAIAISPVHALFSANPYHYGPYAPSTRAALNILHIPCATSAPDHPLIDWPQAARAKLAALRAEFHAGHDHAALAAYRAGAGAGIARHALFEALSATLSEHNPSALDWRNWPEPYRHPENPAIARFAEDNAEEVAFHAWAQLRAGQALAAAHHAAREAGAEIGLITDLAVGTDHAGSASWSRQDEVLKGLELGAPPDLINREGQSWGITAFSPRGLRNRGYAAFLEMLRLALRHAGGVRIDHVMGLARLWVIPAGFPSAAGAYLTLPADDLMRLVRLESFRHRAVILGEDLGTLPQGFGPKLSAAGISGLRVLWFEKDGDKFTPPQSWTQSAVAMTTTHDLATLAGWWEGKDIAWREKLGMAGETAAERKIGRAALWSAFQTSGATAAPQPPDHDGAAVTYPAAAHLGRAACTLALLPVEDALSLTEQPNLPGTQDEHPNWRRRLPGDAQTLFSREDFEARLAILNETRKQPPFL